MLSDENIEYIEKLVENSINEDAVLYKVTVYIDLL